MLHGQTRYNLRSRFFDELPEGALKWITPKRSASASAGAAPWGSSGAMPWEAAPRRNPTPQPAWGRSSLSAPDFGAGPVPERKSEPEHGLRVGMAVFHNKFGEGKVLAIEGAGADARAQVQFTRHGTKWLALSVAKLTPV
jgi:DNA helicase-2/ATP-dependent DNA helicase PcrA